MNYAYDYLHKLGYDFSTDYYSNIAGWINIWKGDANWLNVRTINNKKYPMYSLNMAKRSCEDLASAITSEPFTIKAKKNDKLLQEEIKNAKVLEKLPKAIETMAYSGTVAMITRIKNAKVIGEDENARLDKTKDTKINTIIVNANQIIPLSIVDGEIQDVAFVSDEKLKINGKYVKVVYMELHQLLEKGYQITNKYFKKEDGKEIEVDGVVETYNTLSKQPLFAIGKLPRVNPIDNNNGLGISLFGDSIDQLKILDLTYNNFGSDFRLGQKIMLVNKKLTKITTEDYKDKDGNIKQRKRVQYPTDIQKQLFTDISDGILGTPNEAPYIYEYNPDLRVGDNKEGVQFALDNFSFKVGFGTHYYSFDKGNLMTATEAVLSRQDFVVNGNKVRRSVNEFLKKISKALLLCNKIMGINVDETQEIEVAEVDGFLMDDESQRDKLFTDLGAGLISKKRYLMKVYKMSEEEALKELQEIEKEENLQDITPDIEEGEE